MKKALIVIDLQNAFITPESATLPARIAAHIDAENYDLVLFPKFVNYPGSWFEKKIGYTKCAVSPDIDIVPELQPYAEHMYIFDRTTYSVFTSHPLVTCLRQNGIEKVYLCGLDIDACVLASAYHGFDRGIDCEVLIGLTGSAADAVCTTGAEHIITRNLS